MAFTYLKFKENINAPYRAESFETGHGFVGFSSVILKSVYNEVDLKIIVSFIKLRKIAFYLVWTLQNTA